MYIPNYDFVVKINHVGDHSIKTKLGVDQTEEELASKQIRLIRYDETFVIPTNYPEDHARAGAKFVKQYRYSYYPAGRPKAVVIVYFPLPGTKTVTAQEAEDAEHATCLTRIEYWKTTSIDHNIKVWFIKGEAYPAHKAFVGHIGTQDPNTMEMLWDTSKVNEHFNSPSGPDGTHRSRVRLPLAHNQDYQIIVDWGDGQTTPFNGQVMYGGGGVYDKEHFTHTYTKKGVYLIKIHEEGTNDVNPELMPGGFGGLKFYMNRFDVNYRGSDRLKLLEIRNWGCFRWMSAGTFPAEHNTFLGCENLDIVACDQPNVYMGTNYEMKGAFKNCTNLKGLNHPTSFSAWDTSMCRDMGQCFENTQFNCDIQKWNTTEVIDFPGMFRGNTKFNYKLTPTFVRPDPQDPNLNYGSWNVQNSYSFSEMFKGATSFNQQLDKWDTRAAYDMSGMFEDATSFNPSTLDANPRQVGSTKYLAWQTGSCGNFDRMFKNASAFNGTIFRWDTTGVFSMKGMFSGSAFNKNINTKETRRTWGDDGGMTWFSWNVANVMDMSYMFASCPYNKAMPDWNTSQVEDFTGMFRDNTAYNQPMLHELNKPHGTWNITQINTWGMEAASYNGQYFTSMFNGATAFNQPVNSWNFGGLSKPMYFKNMFKGATSFNRPTTGWSWPGTLGGSRDYQNMFSGATLFDKDISGMDYRNLDHSATSLKGMLKDTAFSQPTYYLLLKALATNSSLPGQTEPTFGGVSSAFDTTAKYGYNGEQYRNKLKNPTGPYQWTGIVDGGHV